MDCSSSSSSSSSSSNGGNNNCSSSSSSGGGSGSDGGSSSSSRAVSSSQHGGLKLRIKCEHYLAQQTTVSTNVLFNVSSSNNNNETRIERRKSRFFTISSLRREPFPTHIRSSGSGAIVCKSRATHRAHITCNMSCYVPRGTKGQLIY